MLQIIGGNGLQWEVNISGSKNASLPIIAATLLIRGKVTLTNVPHIGDIESLLSIVKDLWVTYTFLENTLEIDSTHLSHDLDGHKVQKIRGSIFLLSPILHFFQEINIPFPWGCSLGKRPIDAHLKGLEVLGYTPIFQDDMIQVSGEPTPGDKIINAAFSVWSTENIIIASVLREGKTVIKNAATEPHVMNLIDFFRVAGANIKIRYNHEIIIEGVKVFEKDFSFPIISDYIESATFMIIGALASERYIDIKNARIHDLYTFIDKIHEAGVVTQDLWNDTLRVFKAQNLKAVNLQTNIFPGFPTDIQSPFAVLMTQAEWTSKIHEVLFENRLNVLIELEKMRANVALLNPHEALIFGKKELKWWVTVTSWDLRAGAAMVIAGLIAKWETKITNVEYIHRGYEKFVYKLKTLGADISEQE